MKTLLLTTLFLFFTFSLFTQITANGNTGTSTTTYTDGSPNDDLFIWSSEGLGVNAASLTATPPSGTGPWDFEWFYHDENSYSWQPYTTENNVTTSTISNLPSDGYRVQITDNLGDVVGCYNAWVWNMNGEVSVSQDEQSCDATNLTGTVASNGSFRYYNPPEPQSLITSDTEIEVCFTGTHTWVSDLVFYLTGPDECGNPVIDLTSLRGICNSGNNFDGLCFSTESSAIFDMCSAATPLTGTYGRFENNDASITTIDWTPLYGCNAASGGWRVQVFDCTALDVGALTNASVSFSNLESTCGSSTAITYDSGPINSPINDNSCDAASASVFEVPPSTAFTIPIDETASTTYEWTSSPVITYPSSTTGSLTQNVTGLPDGETTFTLTTTVEFDGVSADYSDDESFTVVPGDPVASNSHSVCNNSSTSVTLSNYNGNIQWEQSANGTTGWVDVSGGSGGTTDNYTTPDLTADIYYRAVVTDGVCVKTSNVIEITIDTPPTAPTSITGTTTICEGTGTTLTASGGAEGDGAVYQWGTGAVGTNVIGGETGVSITTGNLAVNTTYWVRRVGTTSCTNTTGATSQLVTVEEAPTAPTSITGTTTICEGTGTTLTASGGTEGGGAVYEWGTGSVVGSNIIGGQTSVSLTTGNLTSNTTYWVRRVGTTSCTNPTDGVTQLVTVEEAPTAPTSINGVTTICVNSSTTLTASGGSDGDGAEYEWGTGTVVGVNTIPGETGASYTTPSLTTDTDYWVRRVGTSSCIDPTGGVSITVIINNDPPLADVGIDQEICAIDVLNINATAQNGDVTWTIEDGTGLGTFSDDSSPTTIFTPSQDDIAAGSVTLRMTVQGTGTCAAFSDFDEFVVTINNDVNEVPTVDAGVAAEICAVDTYTLGGTATNGTGEWSGGTGTFSPNANDLNAVYTPSAAEIAAGTVTLTLTVTGDQGTCNNSTTSDGVTITINNDVNEVPTVDAGIAAEICAVDTYTLDGTATNGTGEWSGGTGTFSPNANDLNAVYTPSAAEIAAGTVTLTLTVTGDQGTCNNSTTSDDLTITINNDVNEVPTADAGVAAEICAVDTYTLDGTATNGVGVWSGGTGTFSPNANDLNAVYTPSAAEITAGTVTLTLTVTGDQGTCNTSTTTDEVTITINNDINEVPVVDAGEDTEICVLNSYDLDGTATNGVGVWSGGTGTYSPNANAMNGVYTPSAAEIDAGSFTLTLTVTGDQGTCNTSIVTDQVTVVINSDENDVPVADAGEDVEICAVDSYTLDGTATNGIGEWSGGTGTFAPNANDVNAVYTPSAAEIAAGTVTLTFTVNGGFGSCNPSTVTDEVTITINNDITEVPVADAGEDVEICALDTYTLDGTVTNGTGIWSGGSGTFSPNANDLNAVYTPSAAEIADGIVTLTLTVTGDQGTCNNSTTSDDVIITINNDENEVPSADAGEDTEICVLNSYDLDGIVTNGTGVWSGGTGTYSPNANAMNGVYTPSAAEIDAGSFTLTLTVTGDQGTCNTSIVTDQVTVAINNNVEDVPVADAGEDVEICAVDTYALNGVATNGTGVWSSDGSGTFSPDENDLNAVYTPSAADIAAGTVTLTLTVDGGFGSCNPSTAIDEVTITINNDISEVPFADAGIDQEICAIDRFETAGTAQNGTASWSVIGTGTFADPSNPETFYTPSLEDIDDGTFTLILTVTGDQGTCSNATISDSVTVTINDDPADVPVLTTDGDEEICALDIFSTSAIADNGTTSWTTSGTGVFEDENNPITTYEPSATDIANGSVDLTIVVTGTQNSCSGSQLTETITLTINSTDVPVLSVTNNVEICAGDEYVSDAQVSNGTINWETSGNGSFDDVTIEDVTYTPSNQDITNETVSLTITVEGTVGACLNSIIQEEVIITINSDLVPTVDAGEDQSICAGNLVELSGSVTNGDGNWQSSGTGNFDDASSLDALYTPSGLDISSETIVLELVAEGTGVCSNQTAIDELTVTILPVPDPPTVDAEKTICESDIEEISISPSMEGEITWYLDEDLTTFFAEGTAVLPLSEIGTTAYYVTEYLNGCESEPTLLTIIIEACEVEISEAITPNGDGFNDVFIIGNIESFPNTQLTIFNRWGAEIYHSDNYQNDWGGTVEKGLSSIGEVVPEGTYYYLITLGGDENSSNYQKNIKGWVYVKP